MRDILPCGIFSCLCGAFPCAGFLPCGVPSVRGSFRAGFFLVCAGLSLVRGSFRAGFLPCGVLFRAGLFLVRGFFLSGASSVRGSLPPPGLVRSPGGFPHAPGLALYYSLPRCMPACPTGRAPRRAFPCRSACRRTLPGAFFRVLRACGCPRRTVVPRSVFDSLLKSPGPVLGIPPNFSYLWMQKMSFAALKTYRTE